MTDLSVPDRAPITWRNFIPLRGIFRQRWQILFLIRKEFLASHRRSTFGLFWSLVTPVIPITAYIVLRLLVAADDRENGIHPLVYVTVGVTLWLLFRDMVRVPLAAVTRYSATIANTELTAGGAVLVGFGGILLDTALRIALCVPILLATSAISPMNLSGAALYFAAGIGFCFAIGLLSIPMTVIFPDLKNIYDTVFSYLIFFSLAIFPFDTSEGLARFIEWIPFASFIDAVRSNLLLGTTPETSHVVLFSWFTLALLVIAFAVTRRVSARLKEAFL